MEYLTKMLGQPSSYAGLAAGCAAFASNHVGTPLGYAATILAGVFGLVAFFKDSHPAQ